MLAAKGPLGDTELRTLRAKALIGDETITPDERIFLTALTDADNAKLLADEFDALLAGEEGAAVRALRANAPPSMVSESTGSRARPISTPARRSPAASPRSAAASRRPTASASRASRSAWS